MRDIRIDLKKETDLLPEMECACGGLASEENNYKCPNCKATLVFFVKT